MSERLTAKQIKQDIREDEVQSFLVTLINKFQENPSLYVGLVGGFLVIGLLISGITTFLGKQNESAQARLGELIDAYSAPVLASGETAPAGLTRSYDSEEARLAATREALEEVGGGSAGEVAELYEAQLALAEGNTDEARRIWESFLRGNGDSALAVSVRTNLIELDRAEGKHDELAERLQSELDGRSDLPEDVLLYQLARTREDLGQTTEADALYQRILDDLPASPYAAAARQATTSEG